MAELMYDEFRIQRKQSLNNDDINALTKMYLPLIGIDSYAMYFVMSTLETSQAYNYRYLLDCLNLRGLKSLNNALNKLEGIGLITAYINKDKNYLYDINRPLSIYEFLKEESLKALLESQIGSDTIKSYEEMYVQNYSGYNKVSKKFSDVYDTKLSGDLEYIKKLVQKVSIEIENKEFNYPLFKAYFDTSFLTEDALDDPNFKANILRLSFIYKLSEEKMKDVVLDALDVNKSLDYPSLADSARKAFRKINQSEGPRIATLEEDDYLSSIKDDQTLALCAALEHMSPTEVLSMIAGPNTKPSVVEIKMFDDLSKNTNLPLSVINFMILMVSNEKDGELPGYSYFEKIANTWARAKVKNINDALNYLEKRNKKNQKDKKTTTLPDWYDDYSKELNQKITKDDDLSNEDKNKIMEEAKGLFGDKND